MGDIKFMKVYRGTGKAWNTSQIRLQGKWLEELGFSVGTEIVVKKEMGRIVLVTKEGLNAHYNA